MKAKTIEDSNEENEVVYLNYRLATVYRKLGMYEEAIKCYEEDYADDEDEDTLFEIYNVYMDMGDFKRGEDFQGFPEIPFAVYPDPYLYPDL